MKVKRASGSTIRTILKKYSLKNFKIYFWKQCVFSIWILCIFDYVESGYATVINLFQLLKHNHFSRKLKNTIKDSSGLLNAFALVKIRRIETNNTNMKIKSTLSSNFLAPESASTLLKNRFSMICRCLIVLCLTLCFASGLKAQNLSETHQQFKIRTQ